MRLVPRQNSSVKEYAVLSARLKRVTCQHASSKSAENGSFVVRFSWILVPITNDLARENVALRQQLQTSNRGGHPWGQNNHPHCQLTTERFFSVFIRSEEVVGDCGALSAGRSNTDRGLEARDFWRPDVYAACR